MLALWIPQCPVPPSDLGSRPPARQIRTQKLCISVHVSKKKKKTLPGRDYRLRLPQLSTPLTLLGQLTLAWVQVPVPVTLLCGLVLSTDRLHCAVRYTLHYTCLCVPSRPPGWRIPSPKHSLRVPQVRQSESPHPYQPFEPLSKLTHREGTYNVLIQ